MIKKYGPPSEWQKAMIYKWVNELVSKYKNKKLIIFEGQVNLDFVEAAFKEMSAEHYSNYSCSF